MKRLLLLLISTNLYAQHTLKIERGGFSKPTFNYESIEKSCEELIKVLPKKPWLKYEFTAVEIGSKCSRVKQSEEELGIIDSALELVGLASGELEYLHPINFAISYEDKTQDYLDLETNKSKLDKLKEDAKNRDLKIDEINELLRSKGIL